MINETSNQDIGIPFPPLSLCGLNTYIYELHVKKRDIGIKDDLVLPPHGYYNMQKCQ